MIVTFTRCFILDSFIWAVTLPSGGAESLDAPQVPSTSGLIVGHRAPGGSSTFEFLGIKDGQAPIGDQRFASPQRYIVPHDVIYNASYLVYNILLCTRYSRLTWL